jgi:predicted site-specific integrase-resolvase
MNIGYARVSANHQNLDRQIALLKRARCKQIFKEKRSGREGIKRPQLVKAIDALSPDDVLIVAKWDRATRSLLDGIWIICCREGSNAESIGSAVVGSHHAAGQGYSGVSVRASRG